MDHIWEALNRLQKSLTLIFLKKLAIILRQDFLKTLYLNCFFNDFTEEQMNMNKLVKILEHRT